MRNFLMPALMLTATLSLVACSGGTPPPPPPTNNAPVANFTITPTNLAVATVNTSSDADAGETATLTYEWSWGDGSPVSTGATPSHTYSVAGTYTVTLKTTDIKGANNSKTASVTVSALAVAPTILSVSPADASLGNLVNNTTNTAGAPIVITFSTPMDHTPTENAYQSTVPVLNNTAMAFSWNLTSTVLTITPALGALTYAISPAAANNYTYFVNIGAKSAAGLTMAAQYNASFSTAVAHNAVKVYSDPTLDQSVTGLIGSYTSAFSAANPQMLIGDNSATRVAAYLSFDLSTQLSNTVKPANILTATLNVKHSGTNGTPYTNLVNASGKLKLYSVFYGTSIDNTTAELVPNTELANDLDGFITTTFGNLFTRNVLSTVQTDWTARAAQTNLSQYQLRFPIASNNGGIDYQKIYSSKASNAPADKPFLLVSYLDDI